MTEDREAGPAARARGGRRVGVALGLIVATGVAACGMFAGDPGSAMDLARLRDVGRGLGGFRKYNGDTFPAGTHRVGGLPPERGYGWFFEVLPYIENAPMYISVDQSRPWDDQPDARAPKLRIVDGSTDPKAWAIRFDLAPDAPPGAPFVGIAGLGPDAAGLPAADARVGVFGDGRRTRMADITDGASSTLMVATTGERGAHWMAGGRHATRGVDPARRPHIGTGRPFGAKDGAASLFADGSVRWVKATVDPKVFEASATIHGGETVPEGALGESEGR